MDEKVRKLFASYLGDSLSTEPVQAAETARHVKKETGVKKEEPPKMSGTTSAKRLKVRGEDEEEKPVVRDAKLGEKPEEAGELIRPQFTAEPKREAESKEEAEPKHKKLKVVELDS